MKLRYTLVAALTLLLLLAWAALPVAAQGTEPPLPPAYRSFPLVGSRVAIWIIAELHLMFAAFVLGVPIFAVIAEYIGVRARDTDDKARYDRLAKEFTKLLLVAFSTTATFGAVLLFLLIGLYPGFFNYLTGIFFPSMALYAFLFFGEAFSLYLYWYSWDRLMNRKGLHLALGISLNLFGTALMFIANAWASFMMSPAGVDEGGALVSLWGAVNNLTWIPLDIHRFIANIAFGGAIVAAYAASRFLGARTADQRAHYDWMGYTGNFIAILALIPLPFAGYLLGREIYAFNEQMGITLMGGFLSWLWVIQGLLIGTLFLASNFYFWVGLGRIEGGERYKKYTRYLLFVLTVSFLVWVTPHSLVASLEEARKIGAAYHPVLGVLGVMSAKNTAVNIMILATFLSWLFYRRANKIATVTWERGGKIAQGAILAVAAGIVIGYGLYGYYDFLGLYGPRGEATPAIVRIGFSVYQVAAVLAALLSVLAIDVLLFRNARSAGAIAWGKMPPRSQYILFLNAITFTWLMGLMGYARSAARQYWHVFGIMKDTSPDAYLPSLGSVANVVSIIVLLFLAFILFIFWIARLGEKPEAVEAAALPAYRPERRPEPVEGLAGVEPASSNPGRREEKRGRHGDEEKRSWRAKIRNSQFEIRMSDNLKLLLFGLVVIGFYTYFANSIPQTELQPPEEITEIQGELSPQEMARLGEEVVGAKGGCLVCHGVGQAGPRAPDLAGVGARAAERVPGLSAEEYLFQSLRDPSAYVVEGFEAIMPQIDKPPVALTEVELALVVAYLQSLGGEITVQLPGGAAIAETPAPVAGMSPEEVFAQMGCVICHKIEGQGGEVGPDLSDVGARHDAAYIREAIVDPNATVAEGFTAGLMPPDFGAKLTEEQLKLLVEYLASLKGG